jgi:hypothetical protein
VKTWPEHNGDVYNPSPPVAAIEKATGAGDFDAPPGRAAVDAAGRGFGRGGGGFLRLSAARHLRFQSHAMLKGTLSE